MARPKKVLEQKAAKAPAKAPKKGPKPKVSSDIIVRERPLYEQFTRIGGEIGPRDVSWIIREADAGRPARLVDLFNEGRQKDGHLQSTCSTREGAVGLCELRFLIPDALGKSTEETDLCRRVMEDFQNWPTLIEHLTGSFITGHSTAVLDWKKTDDGLLLPFRARPIPQRNFFFREEDGKLMYSNDDADFVGTDLLAKHPGRVIQVQRRINGDVPVREGLIRCLVWAALFRNWALKDWLALGEIGWKPWRIGKYAKGSDQEDINGLISLLERIGSSGVGVIPDNMEVNVEWPKFNRASSSGDHGDFFTTVGREVSKVVLGTTSSIEESKQGDRAATVTRDQLRVDIRKRDAVILSSFLREHIFNYVVSINLGQDRIVPVPWFQADDSKDMVTFSTAVKNMSDAGVRISQKWVRQEFGAKEPEDGEEVIGNNAKALGARDDEEIPTVLAKPAGGDGGDGGDHPEVGQSPSSK